MGNNEYDRIVEHHLEPENTKVHWLSSHPLGKHQKNTFDALHGRAKINWHDSRFRDHDHFIQTFLKMSQEQETAGIYFVAPASWKETILDQYLEKINGTTFGWFIGFGYEDRLYGREKSLILRYRHKWLTFPIQLNFGKTEEDQRKIKEHFSSQESK
jgi:hypothetical protein